MNTADYSSLAPWLGIQDKPEVFPPADHTHALQDIEQGLAKIGEVIAWNGKRWAPLDLVKDQFADFSDDIQIIKNETQSLVRETKTLKAGLDGNIAGLTQTLTVLVDKTQSLAQDDEELHVLFGRNQSDISSIKTTISNANQSTASVLTTLRSQINAQGKEVTAAATAVNALTTSVTKNGKDIKVIATSLVSVEAILNDPSTGLAGIASTVSSLSAQVTLIDGNLTALTSTVTALTATVSGNFGTLSASITTTNTAFASADVALGHRIDLLSASTGQHVFVEGPTPTAIGVNDIWFNTSDGDKVHYWDGSAWVDNSDGRIPVVVAAVATESTARATADGNLSAKYTLKVIAGDIVTGMNVTSSTGGGTDISDITFQATSFKVYNGTTGQAPFQVVGGSVKIDGSLIVNGTVTATQVGTNLIISSSANIGLAVIDHANIASVDVGTLLAGAVHVALELTAGKFTAGIIATGAARFNTADDTRLMPFTSYGDADLVAEFGGPITPADTSTSGTVFSSTGVTFMGWTSGSTGVDTKRFGQSTTAFFAVLQGNGNVPTGRMGYDIVYRVNGGSWNVITGHNVVDNTAFGNISMSRLIPIPSLAGSDTIEFGAIIDHSSGAAGPGIGGLFLSVGVFNS